VTSTFQYGANVYANDILQHYLRYGGAGAPLILIPGIISPAITWGFVAERLGREFDTYVLDVRGRGLSQSGPDLDYTLDAKAADVIGFSEAMGLKGCILLGHSMGARIAAHAARRQPGFASRIVLVDPPVSGPGRRPYPTNLEWYTDVLRTARQGITSEDVRRHLPCWDETHLRLRAEWLHTCDETAIVVSYRGFHEDDFHYDLSRIGIPMLLVVAGKGGVILPEDVEEIRLIAPQIEIAEVPNSGHMIPWEDFDGFFKAIEPFLTNGVGQTAL
jgi:N-formylmaleamate deformylase